MIRRILKLLAGLIPLLLLIGFGSETWARRRDRTLLPRIGQPVDIGGRSMNLNCLGSGSPVVVLDAGASTPGYSWLPIQRELAALSTTCWYDRAGEGGRDPAPFPLTAGADVSDLHELLRQAHLAPPYLLLGHSLGGLDVRIYAGRYPEEVAGVVLIDSSHEDEPRRAPPQYLGATAPPYARRPLHL